MFEQFLKISGCLKMTIIYFLAVILLLKDRSVNALEEESISINKPILRDRQEQSSWAHFSTEYVRCFCNLPACVSTGYMCRSRGGRCFSDLLEHSTPRSPVYRGRHGCLELLTDKEQRKWCKHDNENTSSPPKNKKHPKSLFLCCYHDMCNHVDSPQTKNLINNTLLDILDDSSPTKSNGNRPQQHLYSNSEVWFRAATIAVPICGAFILFFLMALAIKILRNENQNSNSHKLQGAPMYIHHVSNKTNCQKYQEHLDGLRLKQYLPPVHNQNMYVFDDVQRQIQVPLLVQNETSHTCDKNETNAKLNLMHCEEYLGSPKNIILDLEKDCTQVDIVNNTKRAGNVEKFSKDAV